MDNNNSGGVTYAVAQAALIPGIEIALRSILKEYNAIIMALGAPGYELVERVETVKQHLAETRPAVVFQAERPRPAQTHVEDDPVKIKRAMSEEQRERLRQATKKRWRAAKRAGRTTL